MPIRMRFDPELRILFTTAEGVITLKDVQAHLDEEEAECHLDARELFDASAATTDLTSSDVKEILVRLKERMQKGQFGPTSVVTRDDTFFWLASMLSILSDLG